MLLDPLSYISSLFKESEAGHIMVSYKHTIFSYKTLDSCTKQATNRELQTLILYPFSVILFLLFIILK